MSILVSLLSILAVLVVGVVSPGPSFLLVAQTAVSQSRRAALASALGMALGATLLCILALLGLQAVLLQFPRAALALKVVGGLYLVYLAFRLGQGARRPLEMTATPAAPARPPGRHFLVALGVMLTNPKAAVQYGIVFGTFLPAHPPLALTLLLPIGVFGLEAGWYALVACVLSAPRARASYLGAKRYLDGGAALVLGGLGLRLLVTR